jgi:MFS family permease
MLQFRASIRGLVAPYRGLGPSLWSMFAATMINRFGDFVSAFLALYLSRRLGFDAARAGVVVALAMGASALGALASGRIADRLGRKRCLIACHLGAATFDLAMSFLYGHEWAPLLVIASNLFRGGVKPLISALIADIAPVERRKEAFALQYWSINVGVAVGPMVAALLFERALPWLFRGDAICTVLSVALIARGVAAPRRAALAEDTAVAEDTALSEGAAPAAKPGSLEARDERGALRAFAARPILVAFCFLSFLANFTYSQTNFSLPLTISESVGSGGPAFFGAMISLNAITVIALSLPVARVFRTLRPLSCMAFSGLFYVLGFGLLALPIDGTAAWGKSVFALSTVVWTLGEIVNAVNMGIFVAKHSPVNWRASFQSFTGMFAMAGASLGPLAAGPTIAAAGHGALWAATAAFCALWGVGALLLDGKDRRISCEL